MSDKLEKCVCGDVGEYGIFHKDAQYLRFNDSFYIECNKCYCETPQYATEDEAATAWNTMQRALKSGWTSEVPTEEGLYLFYDIDNKEYSLSKIKKENGVFIAQFSDMHGDGIFLDDVIEEAYWMKIPYPDPPKD